MKVLQAVGFEGEERGGRCCLRCFFRS
jgi:hypothetical protein